MKAQVRLWAAVQAVVDVEGQDGADCIRKALELAPNTYESGTSTIIHVNNGVTYRLASEYENCLLTPELMPDLDMGFEPVTDEEGNTIWVEENSELAQEKLKERIKFLRAAYIEADNCREKPDPLADDKRPYLRADDDDGEELAA